MIFKRSALIFTLIFLVTSYPEARGQIQAESEQKISDFSLTGFGERGKKTWDVKGKSADIFDNIIKLQDIIGNFYGEKDNIKLTADRGDFDKKESRLHLEENVILTTSSGTRLTTQSLEWDRKNNLVKTDDAVNIERENIITQALGAVGKTDLKQVKLEKDVTVKINPAEKEESKSKIIITCDGPLEIDYEKNVATFSRNVKAERDDSQIYSDTMDIYFSGDKDKGEKKKELPAAISGIEMIIARGNTKIVRGENVSYSDEAVYNAADKKIILLGRPRVVIYSAEEMNAPSGN